MRFLLDLIYWVFVAPIIILLILLCALVFLINGIIEYKHKKYDYYPPI